MISKLKSISGFDYTTKLQRMFQDIGTSRELNAKFAERSKKRGSSFLCLFAFAVCLFDIAQFCFFPL